MSLNELLEINEIVFGVDKPKIRCFQLAESVISFSSITNLDNLSNKFLYFPQNSLFLLAVETDGNFSPYISVDNVINLQDLYNFCINMDGLNESSNLWFARGVAEGFEPIYRKDSGIYVDIVPYYKSVLTRFYFVEYDQTKIMKL